MIINPLALLGLLAAATPVVIYLLLRRRKTEIQWGAGYLLRLALASRKKSSLWRQFVVLAVRTLILALAALLIAQVFSRRSPPSAEAPALPEGAVHRVVLFDNSRSMTVTEDKVARLERAREAVKTLLLSQRDGDTLDLIALMPQAGGSFEPVTLEGKVDELRADHVLAAIPVRDGLISLEPALAAATARLANTPEAAGEIYLLSDFPRELENQVAAVSWFAPLAEERNRNWVAGHEKQRAKFRQGQPFDPLIDHDGLRLTAVNMIGPGGDASQQNVSIDAVTLGTDLLVAGVPTRLYVDAVNNSDREVVAVFDVSSNDTSRTPATRPLKQQTARLNPDEHKRVTIPLTLGAGNGQVLNISARPSRLATQGTRKLSVDVKDALDVWLVADEKDAAAPTDEPGDADFFLRALKEHKDQSTGVRLRTARMNDLTLPIPPTVDAIILAAPTYVTPAVAKPLGDFIRRGGGLIVTVAPSLLLRPFNENLAALLPAPLTKPMRDTIDPEIFLQAQVDAGSVGVQRPLFEEFAGQGGAAVATDLGQARFYNHYRVADPQAVTGVILRLSNGDPLLVEKHLGRGRVYFFASTLGVGWTSLPVRQSYIPLMTRILTSAVAGRTLPLNLDPGATFVTSWPARGDVTLTLPDQSTRIVHVLDASVGQFVILDGLNEPGLYQLADAAGNRRAFTIAGGAAETDLRTLPDATQAKLAAALGVEVFPDWKTAMTVINKLEYEKRYGKDQNGNVRGRPDGPMWPWLLAGMLALYVFETWFVRSV